MIVEGRYMLCTVRELSEWLASKIDSQNVLHYEVPNCDFSIVDPDCIDEKDLSRVASAAMGWYGIKEVNAGFDSDSLMLISDYYGGGCASMSTFFDSFDQFWAASDAITDMILETLCCAESANKNTLLIVDTQV